MTMAQGTVHKVPKDLHQVLLSSPQALAAKKITILKAEQLKKKLE